MVYSQFHIDKISAVQMSVLTVYVNYMKSDLFFHVIKVIGRTEKTKIMFHYIEY